MNMETAGVSPAVKSADRVLAILELFAFRQAPLTLSEVASELGLPMSSVTMLLKTMCARGYLSFSSDTKRYTPTLSVPMLGTWVMGELFQDGAVIALMDQIQKDTGETVILGARNGMYAQYLHTVQSQRLMRFYLKPGHLRPLSDSAIGRALLLHCDEQALREYAAQAGRGRSLEKKQLNADHLIAEMQRTRRQGYAYSDQHTAGICAIALPVRLNTEHPCAIAVAGPTFKLRPKREKVATAIRELSRIYLKESGSDPI